MALELCKRIFLQTLFIMSGGNEFEMQLYEQIVREKKSNRDTTVRTMSCIQVCMECRHTGMHGMQTFSIKSLVSGNMNCIHRKKHCQQFNAGW